MLLLVSVLVNLWLFWLRTAPTAPPVWVQRTPAVNYGHQRSVFEY